MEPVLHIEEGKNFIVSSDNGVYLADASDLCWPPGKWPMTLTTNIGNGMPLVCTGKTNASGAMVYRQNNNNLSFCVFND